jgi:cellulose synthase/poly-beta-1,6-N-acetylglucosamine synthase-like glycosyltransferase/peptidoglycan/xylan/chitin deacetylase (PgdA/CDA1 family)
VNGPEPRAHWVLLGVLLFAILFGLFLQGYTDRAVALEPSPSNGAAAATVVGAGGPVIYGTPGGHLAARQLPRHTVVLTFDDGPDTTWTPRILTILHRDHVRATFFVLGSRVADDPGLVREELDEGDEIGSDTFTEANLPLFTGTQQNVEMSLNQLALAGVIGRTTTLVRPDFSSVPDALTTADLGSLRMLTGQGYMVVLFDRDSGDLGNPGVQTIIHNAVVAGGAGLIVLLHDGGGDRLETVEALPRIIARYRHYGYRFETVTQALGMRPQAGLQSVPSIRRVQGIAFVAALRSGQIGAAILVFLLLLLAGLTIPRAVILLCMARRHARRARIAQRTRRILPAPYHPAVSILVPAFNEAVGIEATARSLAASDYPDLEVVIVDDGSTDATAAIVESLALPNVRLVRQDNAGKAAALNAGLAASHNEVVVMVDGDTVFEPSTLYQLVQPLSDAGVGAVSGNTKVGNRKGLIGRWQHVEYVSAFNLDRRLYDLLHCMPTVPGAIGAFRREALDAVGGVSHDTLAEDTDLTMALQRAGWRVVYEEQARAWTEAPSTLSQLWVQRYRWCYGTLQSVWKHRRAVIDQGPGRSLGRIGLPYLLFFQVLLPLLAPVIDLYFLYGLVFLDPLRSLVFWLLFLALQTIVTAYALRLDGESFSCLWVLPLQQFVYRQLMYLVIIQSVTSALAGVRLRWHKLLRSGDVVAGVPARGGGAVT